MIQAQDAFLLGEQLPIQMEGFREISGLPGEVGDVEAGRERVGVVGAQDALLVEEQRLKELAGSGEVSSLPSPERYSMASGQSVGVFRAKRCSGRQLPILPNPSAFDWLMLLTLLDDFQRIIVPTKVPEVVGFSRRRILVQGIARIMLRSWSQLGDSLDESAMSVTRIDREGRILGQMLVEGFMKQPNLLGIGARLSSHDQPGKSYQSVAHTCRLAWPAKLASCLSKEGKGEHWTC